jgi:DNA-binding NarL/FixJ family response regulator
MTVPGSPLTVRELEVLRAVCRPGASIRSAAHELGITPGTTRNHLRSLYRTLGVNSAAQAAYVVWGGRRPAA